MCVKDESKESGSWELVDDEVEAVAENERPCSVACWELTLA